MHLHLNCQFGIAGDMLLASLIDAGADMEAIRSALEEIPLPGFELECKRTFRNGVAAMLADVYDRTNDEPHHHHHHDDHEHHDHGHHEHGHQHDHDHEHEHGHHHHHHDEEHKHKHEHHGHGHQHGPHRKLADLLALLEADCIAPRVKERAAKVFRILAEAEATVHGRPVEEVHFHEVSGIDTAVDVIGSCIALELLDVQSVSASPPAVGSGMVMCEHGIFPVPAPATLEILKTRNIPWRPGGEGERATPTGVALLAGLADAFGDSPALTVTRIGYGAGHKEFPDVPNLLRAIIGKPGTGKSQRRSTTIIAQQEEENTPEAPMGSEMVTLSNKSYLPAEVAAMLPDTPAKGGDRVLEFRFAVDDMTPESLAFLCEQCLAAGAAEAYAVAAVMKKGRSGHEVTVLAQPELAGGVVDVIWENSTTFGLRLSERSRLVLARDVRSVTVQGQRIRIKLGWRDGRIIRRKPEYEDCRAASLATGKSLAEITRAAANAAAELS